jgi:hypothetical protein
MGGVAGSGRGTVKIVMGGHEKRKVEVVRWKK